MSKLHVRSSLQDMLGQERRHSITFGSNTSSSPTRESTGRVITVRSYLIFRELKSKSNEKANSMVLLRKTLLNNRP